jgi:hypothetical protein
MRIQANGWEMSLEPDSVQVAIMPRSADRDLEGKVRSHAVQCDRTPRVPWRVSPPPLSARRGRRPIAARPRLVHPAGDHRAAT